jgi:hypothetical protein
MRHNLASGGGKITRRAALGMAASIAAVPAMAEDCQVGPPPHHKGPPVFMDYDQVELDASYDQVVYEPLIGQVGQYLASESEAVRARIGEPGALPTDRRRSKSSTSIGPAAPRLPSLFSSTAATGGSDRPRPRATRPRCSSMPGRIISRSISST